MQVFATKDGKVYKVSFKNFVAATGKKAPYYKRVKKNGEVVEKAYAICPECGNPVHFVNLFSKHKKKKAHARHQRSSIKGLAKYDAAAYKGCPFVLGKDAASQKENQSDKKPSKESKKFIAALKDAFGFSKKSAELICEIYQKLISMNPDMANQLFFAFMASASYNPVSLLGLFGLDKDADEGEKGNYKDFAMGALWVGIGNITNDEQVKNYLEGLGFNKDELKTLFDEIKDQHNNLEDDTRSFYKKPDFSHLCATMATHLNYRGNKIAGDFLTGLHNGIVSTDSNAGYIGDVCGTGPIGPSMNDGDYKSDLDAVNLAILLQSNPDTSQLSIIADYYDGINLGLINRAYEFKKNIGMETLDAQRNAYYQALWHKNSSPMLSDSDIKRAVEDQIVVFDKFIEHIELEKAEWSDE